MDLFYLDKLALQFIDHLSHNSMDLYIFGLQVTAVVYTLTEILCKPNLSKSTQKTKSYLGSKKWLQN